MRRFIVAIAVLGLGLTAAPSQALPEQRPPPAAADREPTITEMQSILRWASVEQQILVSITAPLMNLPSDIGTSRAQQLQWAAASDAWIDAYQVALRNARTAIDQLGPPPQAGRLTAMYQGQADRIGPTLATFEQFAARYRVCVTAVRRGDVDALRDALVNVMDARILLAQQFREINSSAADQIENGNPQQPLLRSFAASYDGFTAVLRIIRQSYYSEPDNRTEVANLVETAANEMTRRAQEGRAATAIQLAAVAAVRDASPQQQAFLDQYGAALRTFPGSFDREEQVAAELTALALSLRGAQSFQQIIPELGQHLDRIGQLDGARMGDIQRRTTMMQNPPS